MSVPNKKIKEDSTRKYPQKYQKLIKTLLPLGVAMLVTSCGGGGGGGGSPVTPPPVNTNGPAWSGYGHDAQHTDLAPTAAQGGVAAQNLGQIVWETSVDLAPNPNAPVHYGSPMITAKNTVVVPVKTTLTGGFQLQALQGGNGQKMWTATSDYIPPTYNWISPFGATLTSSNRIYMAGAGGKVIYIDNPDAATVSPQSLVFYGANAYNAAPAAFNSSVTINTPITADPNGNIFFGFTVTGSNPANLVSGIARIDAFGNGSWMAANTAALQSVPMNVSGNSAPALSNDLMTLYVVVHTVGADVAGSTTGYLLALNSTTLVAKNIVQLNDPYTGKPAWVTDDSTASPVIGPDNDVYLGVLESNFPNHIGRGWMLHFDASLSILKTPGGFGWDDTPSIVPASLVPSYTGTSSYLILTKYNNYADYNAQTGLGDGKNKMAILDPNSTQTDALENVTEMKEVMTVLGPTSDASSFPNLPGAVKEWCVNSAAVDPITKAVFVNSEDGFLYRWDLTTGLLSQKIWLDNGYGQAYTPTALGPDGAVYSINAGNLIAVHN